MQDTLVTIVAAMLSVSFCSAPVVVADESVEPPLTYSVKVDDKVIAVADGETVNLHGTFTNPNITVIPQDHRVFSCQGLTFKYPRGFAFEADLADADAKSWTLSGNDFKIMYFVLNATLSASEFANNMVEQFGRENAKVVNDVPTLEIGNQELKGASLHVTLASHRMVMDIYRISMAGEPTKLLVFQDSLDDSGERTKEGRAALSGVKSSLSFK